MVKFLAGFASAGVAQTIGGSKFVRGLTKAGQGIARVATGGLAAIAGGGKFKNGAVTVAFAYAFNALRHLDTQSDIPDIGKVVTCIDDANYTLTNETLPGHKFEYGMVTRSLVVTQDTISVRTIGVGVNTSQLARTANIVAGYYFPIVADTAVRANIATRQIQHNINPFFY